MKLILLLLSAIFLTMPIAIHAQDDIKTKIDTNLMFVRRVIQKSIDDPKNHTSDGVQQMIFEPEVWKADLAKKMNVSPAQFPANWTAPVQDKLDELKPLIESSAKTRTWTQPSFKHPAEEAMAKAKFLEYYKGASVLKIGSSFTDWKMYKNSLGIPTNRFIRGWALLKIPNRPGCQAQEWIIKQTYAGGGGWSSSKVDSFGGGGFFVRCE